MKFSARPFVDLLKLDPTIDVHSRPCPFHPDTRPSMSINLAKSVFFCHGGCGEPRGGGPAQFLFKWAKYVDKKPITMSEAYARVRGDVRVTKDAQTQLREHREREVRLFLDYAAPILAERCKTLERLIASVNDFCNEWPKQIDAPIGLSNETAWDLLARLHQELQRVEHIFSLVNPRKVTPEIVRLVGEYKRLGFFSYDEAFFQERVQRMQQKARELARRLEEQWPAKLQRTPIPR